MLTVNVLKRSMFGNYRVAVADVTFDDSYPANGEPLDPQKFGLHTFELVQTSVSGGYLFEMDYDNNKLKVMAPTSAHIHTETGTDTAANAIEPAEEVADQTDLAAVTVRVVAMGL